jgi:hypothetical protein
MTSRRGARAATIVAAIGICIARLEPTARAAEPASTPDPSTPASELIGDAVGEYDAGHYEEARALFRRAHEKAPSARTLRGIGMASFELRDYVEATRALSAALGETRRPLTDEQRQQVQGLLARAETFVGRFTPRLEPADALVLVDGRSAVREPDGSLLVAFGHHRITARCSRCTPPEKEVEVEVLGGERKELQLDLAVAVPPTATGSGPSRDAGGSPSLIVDHPDAGAGRRTAAVWWGGASAAALVGTAASAVWWGNRAHELDTCHAAQDRCKNESTLATERGVAIGLTVGLGAAAVASGIVAAVLWPQSDRPGAVPVACAIGKETVSCAIRF